VHDVAAQRDAVVVADAIRAAALNHRAAEVAKARGQG
jgi:hypothetical protein